MKNFHGIYVLRLAGIMFTVTVLSFLLHLFGIGKENSLMLFIVGVLLVAYFTNGYQYGIIASIFSVMAFNYFFTEPVRTFSISNKNDVVLLAFFMVTALISSNLSARFQNQLRVARKNEELAIELSSQKEKIKFAMEKEQLRSKLLRGISHDLRTPLTVIAGASSLIAESDERLDKENIKELARDINNQSEWLVRMVENILNMTKIDSGNLIIDKRPEAVEDVINNAITRVRSRCGGRKIIVEIPDDVLMVGMDGKMIVQVFINLLDNAINHTPDNGKIYIRVEEQDGKVWFYVEDDGEGIDHKIENNMFEEFISGRKDIQDAKQGMGLGLAICKSVIEAHGGEIKAENREEGGARFYFCLLAEENINYGI